MLRFDRSTCGAFLKVGQEGIFFAGGDPPGTSALSGNITHESPDGITPSSVEFRRRLSAFFEEFGGGESPREE
jgi:hypothetical protein